MSYFNKAEAAFKFSRELRDGTKPLTGASFAAKTALMPKMSLI